VPTLLARILAMRGELPEVAKLLEFIHADARPETRSTQKLIEALELVIASDADPARWTDITDEQHFTDPLEHLEAIYWRTRIALAHGRRDQVSAALQLARPLLADWAAWQARFQLLLPGEFSTTFKV
jgi:hypothetical protein